MLGISRKDVGHFWGLDARRNGMGPILTNQTENGAGLPEGMMLNFTVSGYPAFRATSGLERGEIRSTRKGKKSIHFNGSDETIEMILRAVISVNQLSIYGAVADVCKELAQDSPSATKHAEN